MVDLWQIYYKDEHLKELFPFAKPYLNQELTVFFENTVIIDLVKSCTADKIGVCSWKLRDKLRKRIGPRNELTEEALNRDFQVLSLTRNTQSHDMIARAKVWHPGFYPALETLWQKIMPGWPIRVKVPIYFNHFVAQTEIYKSYVENFLEPAIEFIKTDERMNDLMMVDSNYLKLDSKASVEGLKKLGLDYYPMHPFVLERCPSIWFTVNKIKVEYL